MERCAKFRIHSNLNFERYGEHCKINEMKKKTSIRPHVVLIYLFLALSTQPSNQADKPSNSETKHPAHSSKDQIQINKKAKGNDIHKSEKSKQSEEKEKTCTSI
ncbi:hypothetical protein BDZ91DRAFT_55081 [Kalaharituber pfeilii]|nr:hypothetical protein BDZ91DRAFT_55081 [Kalaharituber pfeilii]